MPNQESTRSRALASGPIGWWRPWFGHHLPLRMIVAVMLALCVAPACESEAHQEGRMTESGITGVTTDQSLINEALRFGGIVLPTSARALGVQYDKGIDQRYRLVIEIDPDSLQALLSGSGFTTPLEPDPGPFMEPIEGFGLETATTVSSIDDRLAPDGQRTSTVFRRVAVDRSDRTKAIVHMWLFTT